MKKVSRQVKGSFLQEGRKEQILDSYRSRDEVLDSYNVGGVYGNTNINLMHRSWPSLVDLKAKSSDAIQSLRLKKIEWALGSDL